MSARRGAVLVTGATGLVGLDVLDRLLAREPGLEAFVLVRDAPRWRQAQLRLGPLGTRVTAILGDVREPGFGLAAADRARLAESVTLFVHSAADTVFARPLDEARATNTAGTLHAVELAESWPRLERLVYVSTAYVAGRRTGVVLERDNGSGAGWINGYEQSKYEAEAIVRASRVPWVIARAATIVCDGVGQPVRQFNAVHYMLRLLRDGLIPMMPGSPSSLTDVVGLDEVSEAIVALAVHPDAAGTTAHLCAGGRAMTVDDVIRLAWDCWSTQPDWRRRGIPRPALVDLATYELFATTVAETADARLQRILKSLSSFAPQLAYPKRFDTQRADRFAPRAPASAEALWRTVLSQTVPSDLSGVAA